MRFFGTLPIDGAFCEHVVMHEEFAYPVPDSLSDDAAALVEPLSVGVWACRKARVGPGSRVLVVGVGPIGLVCLQAAKASGAGATAQPSWALRAVHAAGGPWSGARPEGAGRQKAGVQQPVSVLPGKGEARRAGRCQRLGCHPPTVCPDGSARCAGRGLVASFAL